MRLQRLTAHIVACGVLLFTASPLVADTIVLKNGRRIVALSVTELGEKIQYETPSGTLTLPKSIVDHIERGGSLGVFAQSAASLAITLPALESLGMASEGNVVEQAAVHDGMIDRDYIGKLENAARGGGRAERDTAALAHHVAAQFEMSRGDMDHALADEQMALSFAPEQSALILNVAYLHLQRSEYRQSLDFLDRARRIAAQRSRGRGRAGKGAKGQSSRRRIQGKRKCPFYVALQWRFRAGACARSLANFG